jgi:hypothetical protein
MRIRLYRGWAKVGWVDGKGTVRASGFVERTVGRVAGGGEVYASGTVEHQVGRVTPSGEIYASRSSVPLGRLRRDGTLVTHGHSSRRQDRQVGRVRGAPDTERGRTLGAGAALLLLFDV